jgi:hypothetical protein
MVKTPHPSNAFIPFDSPLPTADSTACKPSSNVTANSRIQTHLFDIRGVPLITPLIMDIS